MAPNNASLNYSMLALPSFSSALTYTVVLGSQAVYELPIKLYYLCVKFVVEGMYCCMCMSTCMYMHSYWIRINNNYAKCIFVV